MARPAGAAVSMDSVRERKTTLRALIRNNRSLFCPEECVKGISLTPSILAISQVLLYYQNELLSPIMSQLGAGGFHHDSNDWLGARGTD